MATGKSYIDILQGILILQDILTEALDGKSEVELTAEDLLAKINTTLSEALDGKSEVELTAEDLRAKVQKFYDWAEPMLKHSAVPGFNTKKSKIMNPNGCVSYHIRSTYKRVPKQPK